VIPRQLAPAGAEEPGYGREGRKQVESQESKSNQ